MSKRKYDEILTDERNWSAATRANEKQHTLDSDEEDDEVKEDTYNVMNPDDLEGTEEASAAAETNVGFTAFNMKEELEEGHFDKDGHYLWNKDKEIRDNWLDNIDWIKIKPKASGGGSDDKNEEEKGLADSDSEEEPGVMFDPIPLYKQILSYLNPGETVSKALCRLGKGKKHISSAERWKRKKAGLSETDENSDKIVKLTELANELLTRTGNMDIYQEGYDEIKKKVDKSVKHSHPSKEEAELDMYADDFDTKEKQKLVEISEVGTSSKEDEETMKESVDAEVTWELKWSQGENSEIHGPHSSQQMHKWAKEGYFKNSGWVRRTSQPGSFYSAARVDFELYM